MEIQLYDSGRARATQEPHMKAPLMRLSSCRVESPGCPVFITIMMGNEYIEVRANELTAATEALIKTAQQDIV